MRLHFKLSKAKTKNVWTEYQIVLSLRVALDKLVGVVVVVVPDHVPAGAESLDKPALITRSLSFRTGVVPVDPGAAEQGDGQSQARPGKNIIFLTCVNFTPHTFTQIHLAKLTDCTNYHRENKICITLRNNASTITVTNN